MAKIKKAQKGGSVDSSAMYKKKATDAASKVIKNDVRSIGKNVKDFATKQADSKRYERKGKPGFDEQGNRKPLSSMFKLKKSKKGGSFPDLSGDGEVTQKDVLIGRGVLPKTAKKGVKMMKAQDGAKAKVALRTGQLKRVGRLAAKDPDKAGKVAGKMVERASRRQRGKEYIQKNLSELMPKSKDGSKMSKKAKSGMHMMPDGSMMKNSMMKMGGQQAAVAIAMKKEGKTPKKKMQYGGAAASMVPTMKKGGKAMYGKSMMSKGVKMKMGGKCKYGC